MMHFSSKAKEIFQRAAAPVLPALPVASSPNMGLRSVLWCLGAVAVLATMSVLMPHLVGGWAGDLLSGLFTLALMGASGGAWWVLSHTEQDTGEEYLLREAFHSVLSPQLITDQAGQMVMANRAFRGWIDLGSQSALTAITKRFSATPQVEEEFKRLTEKLKKGQAVVAELPVIRGGRVVEWRRLAARPFEGNKNFYHWRFEDVSERRRMEKAMRDEQGKLVDFMAHAPVGIYSVDQNGRFRFVNKTLAGWLQVETDDLIKGDVHIHDIMGEPPKGVAAHALSSGARGELRGEVVLRRRDGQTFPVAITQTIVASEDGKTLHTRSIVRDLSPEREWQQALSLSEYRFQRLFAEAPIGIMLLDTKLTVIECNHAFHSIVNRPREAIVGLQLNALVAPADRTAMSEALAKVIKGNDLSKPIEIRMVADREIIAQVFAKRFGAASAHNEGTVEQGLMLYFIDATEQKKLEVQFAHSQKMQAIGQLAGGVAHDFNNLLTAMIGFCDLLLQRHKPGDQSYSDIMQIKTNGNRAAQLVRQLLAFSRQQTLQPKVLNLVDVLSECTNLLRRLIGSDIHMDMIHGRDLALVKVDQGQMEQVIMNLVVNARDAMPSGGSVTIRTNNKTLAAPEMLGQDEIPAGRYVAIEVADTGTGIPKDIMPRIFEPFFSTKEIGSGTGLGLSTVYGIVRQTGGFIGVESHLGRGTTFTLYFPALSEDDRIREQQAAEEVRDDKANVDLTGAGTILLVEDEDAVRVFSARALKNKGYNLFEARSGEEAMEILEKEGAKIDLMITDVVMPQMDGPTLYKNMHDRWPKIKVVFVSGYTEDRLREQFTSGEEIHFLGKPFTLKQLASKVKEVFEMIGKA